jgi:hypothetical protein
LLQQSHLLSVYDAKAKTVYYYEILEIAPRANDNVSPAAAFFRTDNRTEFKLDSHSSSLSSPVQIRRLPPLISQLQFYKSNNFSSTDDKKRFGEIEIPPHPNVYEVMQALTLPPCLSPKETILHLIGTDTENHVRLCVETAAHQVGMQCLSIRGLAAFAHHEGHSVRTGSLVDQLAGLKATVDYIRTQRMEPCVLHLYDFDAELSPTDVPLRHEQEERFWSKWLQEITIGSLIDTDCLSYRYTPPLLLVISTAAPLKPGPLKENMVFPSIALDNPDREYTQYLWKERDLWNGEDANTDVMELLDGRSAREICWLRQQVQATPKNTKEILCELCRELDANRQKQSSKIAQISNVHWEDVGGLAHVRREILDAIELPLKHPHLFPKNGGRSGILLYGESY